MKCPSCTIKKAVERKKSVTRLYREDTFENGCCPTPPMGWNSWNYFKQDINEKMLLEMAKAIKESGLYDAGYTYLNIDDYWEADRRDRLGKLNADLVKFPQGMKHFVDECNKLGFKVGIYSSNGVQTCQSLPASLDNEYNDALQFATWGIEYLKYDYCYHRRYTNKAPYIFGITVCPKGTADETIIGAEKAALSGTAKLVYGSCNYNVGSLTGVGKKAYYIKGMDAGKGEATFMFRAEKEGEYVITVSPRFRYRFTGMLHRVMAAVVVNGEDPVIIESPKMHRPCSQAPFRFVARLKEGENIIKVFNPIGNRADSAILNYICMSNALVDAAEAVGGKKIAYSVCEWGRNKPWEWGDKAANLWRTTGDIIWYWFRIRQIYDKNVTLYKYASPGHWNDPDMLEVGNGKLTLAENRAHFSLWCMMAAPLLLGNDIVNMKKEHLEILENKNLIAIDQDKLGKQAKRIVKGAVDVLVRPLQDGGIALCAFNKKKSAKKFSFDLTALKKEEYVQACAGEEYIAEELWTGEKVKGKKLTAKIGGHDVKVWKLTKV